MRQWHVVCMTVINTSPLIHLGAVLPHGLRQLASLLGEVVVPYEVVQELQAGGEKDDAFCNCVRPHN